VVEGLSGHRPGGGEVEVAGDGGGERLAEGVHLRERERWEREGRKGEWKEGKSCVRERVSE